MRDVLEDLRAEVLAQRDTADVWASDELLQGYTMALSEVARLLDEQIQIERLAE